MIITPTEHEASPEDVRAAELLIKEARQRSRRRRLTVGVALLAVLLAIVVPLIVVVGGGTGPKKTVTGDLARTVAPAAPVCSLGQLSVISEGRVGAGGTDGEILLFRNISSHVCSLTGYPNVVAIGNPETSTMTASHVTSAMLGGWDWSKVSPGAPKPPTVVLSNKREVASDWYQYPENGPVGATIFHASTLGVGLPGSTSVVHVKGFVYSADGKFWVTPFVPGRTGTAEPNTGH